MKQNRRRKMKKIFSIFVILCLLIALTACGPAAPTKKTITIDFAWLVQDAMMSKLWSVVQQSAADYNNQHPETNIVVNMLNADSKVDKELENVEAFIVQKPDVIVIISTDTKGSIPAYEAVDKAGIKCVMALKLADTDKYDLQIIGYDHYKAGQLQAERLEKYIQDNPTVNLKIGYLDIDPAVTDAVGRYIGFKENFLDKHLTDGRATEVAHVSGMWKTDVSLAAVEDWFQAHPDLNCVVAANDLMALGAIEAAKGANKELIVLGMDGMDAALQCIKEGTMLMSVYSDADKVGKGLFDECLKLALGTQTEKVVNLGTISLITVDESNLDQYMK
jgi:ABC-type sugar transport system substrate-binding protein